MARRGLVEVVASGQTPVLVHVLGPAVLGRFPQGHGDDPLAGRRGVGEFAQPGDQFANGAASGDRRQQPLQRLAIQMRMSVGQARHHGAAGEFDEARVRPGERRDVAIIADRHDAIAAHGKRGAGVLRGKRQDPAAAQDEVRVHCCGLMPASFTMRAYFA